MARKATAKKGSAHKSAPKKAAARKADIKTKPTAASVDAFIDAVSNETRKRDAKTVLAMMKRITGEKPKMWGPSIIGFGQYRYRYESGREGDMCMIGFSPRSTALVLYVLSSAAEEKALLAKLGKHKTGVSCLYVTRLEDVDSKALEELTSKAWSHMKRKREEGSAPWA
jgi:hypothetical protein